MKMTFEKDTSSLGMASHVIDRESHRFLIWFSIRMYVLGDAQFIYS